MLVDVNTVKTTIIPPGEDDENSLSSSMEETLFSPGFKAITQRKGKLGLIISFK